MEILIDAFVSSHLNYWNAFTNLNKSTLGQLQTVQNAADLLYSTILYCTRGANV